MMILLLKKSLLKKTIATVVCFTIISSVGMVNAQQETTRPKDAMATAQIETAAVFPRDKHQAVMIWAEALKQRNGAFRYAILTNELKEQEYEKYHSMHWVIGGSSPHVVSYSINELNKIDDETYEYEIQYVMTDSTKALYDSQENITVKKLGQLWFVIKHENYEYLPEFIKK
ncbi:hypothetical protein [Methylomusa anaerophila]|nr:hypothetical protein [Methylomusa anaerophila]